MADSHAADGDPTGEWLWHRRHTKAYYPIETGGDHVLMASVWHPEELADARECDALVPADEIGRQGEPNYLTGGAARRRGRVRRRWFPARRALR